MLDLETMEQLMSSEEWRKFQKESEHCREDWGPEEGGRAPNLAPRCADYEQPFAGAIFNTGKISGSRVEISGSLFKPLATQKSPSFEASIKFQDPYLRLWIYFCEPGSHNSMIYYLWKCPE